MGGYPHGRGIKSQLANGVGLAIRFIIVSDLVKSNTSEVFPEIGSWWRSPRRHRPRRFGCIFSFFPLHGRHHADADGGRGLFQHGYYAPNKTTTDSGKG